MELTLNKNHKAYKDLEKVAAKKNIGIKDLMLSDESLPIVSDIFYKHMPTAIRFLVKKEKFQEIYKNQRENIVARLFQG